MKPEWCDEKTWATADYLFRCSSADVIALALLKAHQRGRREGMEEAVKVADSYANDAGDKAARGYFTETERASRSTGRSIAATIRAKMEEHP